MYVELNVAVTNCEVHKDRPSTLGQKHFETFKTPLSFFCLYLRSILLRDYIKSPFLASRTKLRYFDFLYVKGYSINPLSKHGSSVVRR